MGRSVVSVSSVHLEGLLFPSAYHVRIEAVRAGDRPGFYDVTISGPQVPDVPRVHAITKRTETVEFKPAEP